MFSSIIYYLVYPIQGIIREIVATFFFLRSMKKSKTAKKLGLQ